MEFSELRLAGVSGFVGSTNFFLVCRWGGAVGDLAMVALPDLRIGQEFRMGRVEGRSGGRRTKTM